MSHCGGGGSGEIRERLPTENCMAHEDKYCLTSTPPGLLRVKIKSKSEIGLELEDRMSKDFSLEECKELFASAPLDAAYTFQMPEPEKPGKSAKATKKKPKMTLPGQHLDIFPPTMPADWVPPLADEPVGDLLPPVYMFGWRYDPETFDKRYPGMEERSRFFFGRVIIDRFYAEHRGVEPPALDADNLVPDEYVVYMGTNFLEVSRRCAEDQYRVKLIQSFVGETDEPMWYRRTLDELKATFAAADEAAKASARETRASGQASKNAPQGRKSLKDYPQTFPRHELPPLAKRPSAKDTFAPLYRLGWMYTLREYVERIMKGNPYADRVTSFEKNVQDPFEAKYPKMWLPNFTLCYGSNHVIVYITTNLDERTRAMAQDQKLVDAAKDILGQDEDPPRKLRRGERLDLYPATLPRGQPPPLTSDVIADSASTPTNPPAPLPHFPPTYFLGWLYQEDDFYERFANKDDEDAWDIYEGFKEMVTGPSRARYPGISVPNFDIEDESKECIVYISYNLEERSLLEAQDQVLIDAAKDILQETREPMCKLEAFPNMWPPMYVLGWSYTPEEFEARLGPGDPMEVYKERIRRPFQAKFEGANVSSPNLHTTSGPCIVSVGSNSSVRSLGKAKQENSIEATKALLGETAEPEWIRIPLAEMVGLF
ncbi:uncharacterized protein SCHCODRAFT_01338629 [Schizophyllum commune H4-8]|uniref:Uncharacterized protein n=1 Tax=Schizophyllum commune (strain H4-8 / FGSC 9210) TaxID=578458 RepID=D8QF79_SCHCM|nr:uncharacterized protein SCHCODRAFT_01338629 [Schizophyllum commune H4-8]KAI5887528.1 hypothetical protein SCHCODRAFT_01338629 [Schizophyllum commune H4-8]